MATSMPHPIVSRAAGVTGACEGHSRAPKILIGFFAALTIYNSIELIAMIISTFKRRKGSYFWSLLISSIALTPYALGFSLKLFGVPSAKWTGIVLLTIGWYGMVTGQSVVLWSRLHLVVSGDRGRKILRYTKWMIIIDVIVLHVPTTVVTFGSTGQTSTSNFARAYNVVEKFQMTGFCLQEAILSIIYIFETLSFLRTSLKTETRSIMQQLILINVAILIMDAALLGIENASLFVFETFLKGFFYSIKLKIEFAIVNRLVNFVTKDKGKEIEFPPHQPLSVNPTAQSTMGNSEAAIEQ